MGLSVNTTELQDNVITKLEDCQKRLEDAYDELNSIKIPNDPDAFDGLVAGNFNNSKTKMMDRISTHIDTVKNDIINVQTMINDYNETEQRNVQISTSITGGAVSNIQNETDTKEIKDVEISDENQNITMEEIVPDTQIEQVIELIYDGNPNLTDEEKERIVKAITDINKTKILEGLDEDIANRIRAEIIKDYLDGELELEEITKEQLQEYIESHPDIQIGFEINEAIENFESLIEAGVVTEEEIKAILENNVEIHHTEEEFVEAYIEAGGTETEVTEVESFYDPETQTVHIRDTVDSVVITNSIITILGEDLFIDEETGEVSTNNPNQVEIGESDVTIEMPNDTEDISGNMTDVEIDENNTTIEMSNDTEDISANITDVEIDENNTTIEMPNDTEDISANITDVEIDENNTTIEMPNDTEDISGNMTDVKINENNTTDNGTINIKDEKNKN